MNDPEQTRRRRRPPLWLATAVLLPTMVLLTVLGMPFDWALVIGVIVTIASYVVVRYKMLKSSDA